MLPEIGAEQRECHRTPLEPATPLRHTLISVARTPTYRGAARTERHQATHPMQYSTGGPREYGGVVVQCRAEICINTFCPHRTVFLTQHSDVVHREHMIAPSRHTRNLRVCRAACAHTHTRTRAWTHRGTPGEVGGEWCPIGTSQRHKPNLPHTHARAGATPNHTGHTLINTPSALRITPS